MPEVLETNRRSTGWAIWLGLALWVWGAACAGWTFAQAKLTPQEIKARKTEIIQILKDNKSLSEAEGNMFDDYFRNYAIPQFTDRENLSKLKDIRKDFRRTYFLPGSNGAAHQQLNKITLEEFTKILAPASKASIAAKLNVLLALCELNEVEPEAGVKAKPLPAVLPILRKYVTNQKINAEADALRITAILGLQIHAESASPENKARIRQELIEIVQKKPSPSGRDPAVNDWLRERAGETLKILGDPGPKGEVALALDAVIDDPAESPVLRSKFAAYLGELRYPNGMQLDFKKLADHVGYMTFSICRTELRKNKEDPSVRQLMNYVRNASTALTGEKGKTGLKAAANESQKTFIATVQTKLNKFEVLLKKTLNEEEGIVRLDYDRATKTLNELKDALEPRATPKLLAEKPADEKGKSPRPPGPKRPQVKADEQPPRDAD